VSVSFANKLLKNDPKHRLGANGIHEIKSHAFFRNFDWESLKNRTLESPIESRETYSEMFNLQYKKVCQHQDIEFQAIEEDMRETCNSSPSI
jgi:hypothetical protein